MKDWFIALSRREQILILGCVGVLVIVLFYSLFWQPHKARQASLQQRVAQEAARLRWMQEAAQEVKRLREQADPGQSKRRDESLLALVDRIAKTTKVSDGITRLEPQGEEEVRVWLDQVNFNNLLRWLGQLKTWEVQVSVVSLQRQDKPGWVSGRLILQGE